MAQDQRTVQLHSGDTPHVTVHEGDFLTLSPDSKTFASAFKEARPRTIDEVRGLLGPRLSTERLNPTVANLRWPELAAAFPSIAELESKDSAVRSRAVGSAKLAAKEYVRDITDGLQGWKPVLDRYLQLINPVIVIGTFADIEVADRATLLLVRTIDAICANQIKLFGTGKIVCQGPVTFRARSFEGSIGLLGPPPASL